MNEFNPDKSSPGINKRQFYAHSLPGEKPEKWLHIEELNK